MANWATVAALGDPSAPEWQGQNLTWIEPIKGQRWQVYKPAASAFEGLLNDLVKLGYSPTSSGGFNYRNIRGGDTLSQHAFGTAIDLNALTNPQGQRASDIPQAAELAKKWGLEWGGNWKNPDPMHFEYTGGGGGGGGGGDLTPQQQWASGLWQYAQAASAKTGIDPRLIMAQAALETGWGKSAPNYNYFGIKGKGSDQKTLEFINGKMQPVNASFRNYQSPEESFADYANLLMGGRYAGVRGAKGLEAQIEALGKSGYATDPDYAAKILSIAQGIPAGGYGAATGPTAVAAAGNTAGAAASPYALPAAPKADPREKFAELASKAVGGFGGTTQPFSANLPQQPAAANVQAEARPLFDPAQQEQRRQQLALLMQRLNQGTLV